MEPIIRKKHLRYKRPIDNLIYCILLQAAKDLDHVDNGMTKTEKETAHTFFESGYAKHFYDNGRSILI